MPNYGFGEIMPNEMKTLRIYFSPNFTDSADSFTIEGNELENAAYFKINLETLTFLGQCKTVGDGATRFLILIQKKYISGTQHQEI